MGPGPRHLHASRRTPTVERAYARRMRSTLFAALVCSCLGWANALGSEFVCPEFSYPTLRGHDLGDYLLTEHGPDHDRPDYVLYVVLQHADGARWCFVADVGRLALVGGGAIREPIDPTHPGTDHTREHGLLLVTGDRLVPRPIPTREGFADLGATVAALLGVEWDGAGVSFARELVTPPR